MQFALFPFHVPIFLFRNFIIPCTRGSIHRKIRLPAEISDFMIGPARPPFRGGQGRSCLHAGGHTGPPLRRCSVVLRRGRPMCRPESACTPSQSARRAASSPKGRAEDAVRWCVCHTAISWSGVCSALRQAAKIRLASMVSAMSKEDLPVSKNRTISKISSSKMAEVTGLWVTASAPR